MTISPSFSATEIWQSLYEACVAEYRAGAMTKDVFRAKLYRLGYRNQELTAEVNLHEPRNALLPSMQADSR